jgi:CheY-like chemotaxis protein
MPRASCAIADSPASGALSQLKGFALLVGRKLLLADDSITIQKVVELTFADEGVQVIAVGSGTEAIEKLEEISPDVVLADVFMPGMTGYQVCEHVKKNERLKHIPVMLLVGSFEPFDEAEARRVGADDTLTKPFQSIRNLVDRVGGLLRGETAADRRAVEVPEQPESAKVDLTEARTVELPKSETVEIDNGRLDTDELEFTTADTRQLSPEMLIATQPIDLAENSTIKVDLEEPMETEHQTVTAAKQEAPLEFGDVLLDLGQFQPASSVFGADDAILDINLNDPVPERAHAVHVRTTHGSAPVATLADTVAAPFADTLEWETVREARAVETVAPVHIEETEPAVNVVAVPVDDFDEQAVVQQASESVAVEAEPATSTPVTPHGQITLDQLSPETIDAIAQRVVAQLSEKAVQEIAWEVVPQLAELLIKRKLEEKEAQPQ